MLSETVKSLRFLEDIECKPKEVVIPYMQELYHTDSSLFSEEKAIENEVRLLTRLPELINQGDYSALREAWEISSSFLIGAYTREVMGRLFKHFGYLSMEAGEQEYFDALPETVKAYRAGGASGMSWTKSKSFAEYHSENTGRNIIERDIPKREIHAFYTGEQELIVFKPTEVGE